MSVPVKPDPAGPAPAVPNLGAALVKESMVHRKFLLSNSTSHVWPFGAIAELIDNAVDPDVLAKNINIDVIGDISVTPMLSITDDGNGLDPERLHKMLSFGFCEKVAVGNHLPIGNYGNGFKSGSMSLGRDALVFTRDKVTKVTGIGFLSQTFNEAEDIPTVKVPIVFWNHDGSLLTNEEEAGQSLSIIIRYSPFKTPAELFAQLKSIKLSGTRILIYNLKKHGQKFYLDFETDPSDIQMTSFEEEMLQTNAAERTSNRGRAGKPYQQFRPGGGDVAVPLDYSLRAYCQVLYYKPSGFHITIRGKVVRPIRVELELAFPARASYRPKNPETQAEQRKYDVTIGVAKDATHTGIMFYHRGRLITPYLRIGVLQSNKPESMGVMGVIQADFLQPTHNKQGFVDSPAYRACLTALASRLGDYCKWLVDAKKNGEVLPAGLLSQQRQRRPRREEILEWVQCDLCKKWRVLPQTIKVSALPEKWDCSKMDWDRSDFDKPEKPCDAPSDDQLPEFSPSEYVDLQQVRKDFNKQKLAQKQKDDQATQNPPLSQMSDASLMVPAAPVPPPAPPQVTQQVFDNPPPFESHLTVVDAHVEGEVMDQSVPPGDDIDISVSQEDDIGVVPTEDVPNKRSKRKAPVDDSDEDLALDNKMPRVKQTRQREPSGRTRNANDVGATTTATPSKRRKVVEVHENFREDVDPNADTQLDDDYPVQESLASKHIRLANAVCDFIDRQKRYTVSDDPEVALEVDVDKLIRRLGRRKSEEQKAGQ